MNKDRTEAIDGPVPAHVKGLPSLTGRLARKAMSPTLKQLDTGMLHLDLPSGERIEVRGTKPGPEAVLRLKTWRALVRLAIGGDIGFAEGYMYGDWTTPDLKLLLDCAMLNERALDAACTGFSLSRLADKLRHFRRGNSRRGSRRNIRAHYDLGNEFYAQWLDAGMNYSSGLYTSPSLTLEDAQIKKLDRVADLLDVKPGDRVLEIGCGWGALAEKLAHVHGAQVTGITLSDEQRRYAQNRQANGASIRLQDYRDVEGNFDKIVSIEMLEAAGEAYWPVYFETLRKRLMPGGTAVLQVITIDEPRFHVYRSRPDFIQRYIFPGGMLPTVTAIREQVTAAGLRLHSVERFGASYALTLAEWRKRFSKAGRRLGAYWENAEFRRMWEYYLAYCEVGFQSGALDVGLYRIGHATD